MTRARKTLTLARLPGRHPLHDALLKTPSALERDGSGTFPAAAPELSRRYRRLGLRDVFLSFAGYRGANHSVHHSIADLSPGDLLQVSSGAGRWELLDHHGTVVGQLASGFNGIAGMRCVSAKVLAVASWEREDSEPEYRNAILCDSWEVVVPELVFEQDL